MAARDFLFQLVARVKGIERARAQLKGLQTGIEGLNAAVTGPLLEAAATMAKVGLVGRAAGGAAAYGLAKLIGPALDAQAQTAHMATAMTEAKDVAEQLAPAHLKLIAIVKQHAESITALREAHYDARATNLDHAQSLAATTRRLGSLLQNLGDPANDAAAFFIGRRTTLARVAWDRAKLALVFLPPMKKAAPLTAVARISFSDLHTALSILAAGVRHEAEAGRSYVEVLTTILNHAKAAADAVRNSLGGRGPGATLARLNDAAQGGIQRAQFVHSLGFQQRSLQGPGLLIDKTDQWAAVHKRLADSHGAGARRAAALAVAANAIYPPWAGIEARFTTMIAQAFAAGVNLPKTFAQGIGAGMSWPIRAVEQLGSAILDHRKMYSPAKLGPLREFGNLPIVESLAGSIRPAPMISAMRRVATVAAVAIPMMVVSAAAPAAAAAAPIVVNVSVNYTVSGGASDDFVTTAEKHGRELARIIQRELERHERTKFS